MIFVLMGGICVLWELQKYYEGGNFRMGGFMYLSNGFITLYKFNLLENVLLGWLFLTASSNLKYCMFNT